MGLFGSQTKQEPVSAPAFEEEPFDELPTLPKPQSTTVIAKGITFTGVIRGEGNVQIEGRLEGAVQGDVVTHASITARPFFEKRGYRVVKEQQVERNGVFLTNFVMVKRRRGGGQFQRKSLNMVL